MDDPFLVRAREAFGDLDRQGKRTDQGKRAAAQRFRQFFATNQLHRDVGHTVGVSHFVNDGDMRMFERGCGTRFLQQALAAGGIVQELVRQDFQRHLASEIDVEGTIDDAHAAAADLVDDLVVREPPADHAPES